MQSFNLDDFKDTDTTPEPHFALANGSAGEKATRSVCQACTVYTHITLLEPGATHTVPYDRLSSSDPYYHAGYAIPPQPSVAQEVFHFLPVAIPQSRSSSPLKILASSRLKHERRPSHPYESSHRHVSRPASPDMLFLPSTPPSPDMAEISHLMSSASVSMNAFPSLPPSILPTGRGVAMRPTRLSLSSTTLDSVPHAGRAELVYPRHSPPDVPSPLRNSYLDQNTSLPPTSQPTRSLPRAIPHGHAHGGHSAVHYSPAHSPRSGGFPVRLSPPEFAVARYAELPYHYASPNEYFPTNATVGNATSGRHRSPSISREGHLATDIYGRPHHPMLPSRRRSGSTSSVSSISSTSSGSSSDYAQINERIQHYLQPTHFIPPSPDPADFSFMFKETPTHTFTLTYNDGRPAPLLCHLLQLERYVEGVSLSGNQSNNAGHVFSSLGNNASPRVQGTSSRRRETGKGLPNPSFHLDMASEPIHLRKGPVRTVLLFPWPGVAGKTPSTLLFWHAPSTSKSAPAHVYTRSEFTKGFCDWIDAFIEGGIKGRYPKGTAMNSDQAGIWDLQTNGKLIKKILRVVGLNYYKGPRVWVPILAVAQDDLAKLKAHDQEALSKTVDHRRQR